MTGASGGLGTPLVQALARLGVEVEAVYNRHRIEPTDAVHPAKVDVSNPYLVAQFFDEIGRFDYLILCHGATQDAIGSRMTTSAWKHVIGTNLSGTFYCLKSGVGKMNDGGVVVAVSSVAARNGIYGAANYAASKTGLEGLLASFALENRMLRFELMDAAFHDAGMGTRLPPRVRLRAQEAYGPFHPAQDFVSRVLGLLGIQEAAV